jgi:ADP-ribosylglycohydrolase
LSVGDAFGERFFTGNEASAAAQVAGRSLPAAPWRWTDDTVMALSVVEELLRCGRIDPDHLAHAFARRYIADPVRGYGRGAHEALGAIAAGVHWSTANRLSFADGSRGNGAAMRSAPIGGYFAGRPDEIAEAASRSALPTHAHPDAVAGAIAVALAASYAATLANAHLRGGLLGWVAARTPGGRVRAGLETALDLVVERPEDAARVLGSGQRVLAEDTVPFALWCADRHLGSCEDALWAAVSGLGDRDTTCAITGGVVALSASPPASWFDSREPLPPVGSH